jgi:hypothetical protein
MIFHLPSATQTVTQWAGQNVVPVRVEDTGQTVDGYLCYAFKVWSRVYPQGTDPGNDIPQDAVELTLVDQQNHIWESQAVHAPNCSNSGSPNTAYVWAKYQKPGMPPVIRTFRSSTNFNGTC